MDWVPTPQTLHCAPLGWPGIRRAMAVLAGWFDSADPALMICDVSAEIAQLSRICSVPHVKVLQHGDRGDAGHRAAYEGAAGLLAPFHADLAQPDWDAALRARTCFAGGLGVDVRVPEREVARQRIGIGADEEMILVLSGAAAMASRRRRSASVRARARPHAGSRSARSSATGTPPSPPMSSIAAGWTMPPTISRRRTSSSPRPATPPASRSSRRAGHGWRCRNGAISTNSIARPTHSPPPASRPSGRTCLRQRMAGSRHWPTRCATTARPPARDDRRHAGRPRRPLARSARRPVVDAARRHSFPLPGARIL